MFAEKISGVALNRERQLIGFLQPLLRNCVKAAHFVRFPDQFFSEFRLNTEVHLRIHSKLWKIRTRKTPNADSLCAMLVLLCTVFVFVII